MKLSIITLASLATLATAIDQDEVAAVTALYGDINGHLSDYLNYIQQGNALPDGLLNLYQEAQTYKDDSYTTLLSTVDFNAVEGFVTGLPWYSSRLAGAFASVTGEGAATSSSAPETSSAAASSSAAATTTSSKAAESSSAAPVTSEAKSTTAAAQSSSKPASSEVAVSTYEGAAANNGQSLIALIVPFVLAAPALL